MKLFWVPANYEKKPSAVVSCVAVLAFLGLLMITHLKLEVQAAIMLILACQDVICLCIQICAEMTAVRKTAH